MIRVILADDHAVVREGTRRLLEDEPDIIVVGEASDGEQTLKQVDMLEPDVLLLDISMPKMSGIEITQQIRVKHPRVRVLVLSAYDNEQYVYALLKAGAAGYILKEVSGKDVIRAIRAVHAGQSIWGSTIVDKVIEGYTGKRALSVTEGTKPVEALSARELEVLQLVAQGASSGEIADKLCLSPRTVQGHLTNIFAKLGVNSRTEAVLYALRQGWVRLN
ncbi:MAG: response regulator transcription factor [Chloroflexi bacterium]|nr:response regulator transcription factor [Chloroflexota bacterium]MCL5075454.1 response regulator transcription factor [Chloroflexota bacterium]